MPPQFSMNPVPRFLWLAFFPQLVAWVGFTITLGGVAGILTAAISRLSRSLVQKKVISIDLS
jgi:hypothetical protein